MRNADSIALSRRQFLINSGWLAAGVTVLSSCSPIYSAIPALPSTNNPEISDAVTWIQVMPNGKVRFYCPRMEMGQAASLGLSQVVAEELNVDARDIECVLPNTNQIPRFKMTVGSQSISDFFEPVSRVCAHLREKMRSMAAEKSKTPIAQVKDVSGGFKLLNGQQLTYAALVIGSPLSIDEASLDEREYKRYSLEKDKTFHAIGKKWKHHELEAIVTGEPLYARDISIPGMVYGHVVKPLVAGSQLVEADVAKAKTMPGVVGVVLEKMADFVGLVVQHPAQLEPALSEMKLKWQRPLRESQDQLEKTLNVSRVRKSNAFEHELVTQGDNKYQSPSTSRHRTEARYETAFASHAVMEPRGAVASVIDKTAQIWCGSQDPFFVQRRIAKALGFPTNSITVNPQRMGGGFGGRVICQASEEAAILSNAVGRPVRVEWDRESEFMHNYFQPRYSHYIAAGVGNDGLIESWQHDFVSSPIITGLVPDNIAWIVDKIVADEGTARSALSPYRAKYQRIRYSDIRTSVPVGAWRGLGSAPNTFAIESMIDELANQASVNPLIFRLNNLDSKQSRLANVLKHVAILGNWDRVMPKNSGLGIACAIYKGETFVAVLAEVEIDDKASAITVKNIWCVQDCGLVINPDQVENQITGNIAWGCSMVLKEQITFDAGEVAQKNFDTYEILRHDEMPKTHIALVQSQEKPSGVGEAAFGPVAPAITNAIFAATGQRIRKLPINPDSFFNPDR